VNIVYGKEKALFAIALAISVLFWLLLIVGTIGMALLYLLLFFVAYLFAQSALVSYLKGTGVRITEQQFPDLHQRLTACAAKLGMRQVPEAYLLHGNGAFNAFATRFLGRDFVVLFSDVVDALDDRPGALNFYIGHELGHLSRRHLLWGPVLFPAGILPLLGAAYSRAREYTCDRHGLACCDDPQDARMALAALAAGGKRWKTMSDDAYVGQSRASSGFWMSFHELIGDYPWLVKRIAAVKALAAHQEPAHPRRNPIAYLFALFVPRLGAGTGAGAGVIVMIAIIGVLAAIAIPAYKNYMERAQMMSHATRFDAGAVATAKSAVEKYVARHGQWPSRNADIGLTESNEGEAAGDVSLQEEGTLIVTVADGMLIYSPIRNASGIRWNCSALGVPRNQQPADCRG
jgi:Zn-dependent protease with chaperone function/type II secretory pathway pseudopilin PulG